MSRESRWTRHFSCCCDKIFSKDSFWKESFVFDSQFEGTAPGRAEVIGAGVGGAWSLCITAGKQGEVDAATQLLFPLHSVQDSSLCLGQAFFPQLTLSKNTFTDLCQGLLGNSKNIKLTVKMSHHHIRECGHCTWKANHR